MHNLSTRQWLGAGLATLLMLDIAPAATLSAPGAPAAKTPATAAEANRASMQTLQIPSHGSLMNALVYVAAGSGPHPLVILLHGFPGNERNLDLAQDVRRAGWDVLYFNYRGSWGTPGRFSFTNSIDDTRAAIAYLRQPAVAAKLHLDPARIVLVGHSMGGFIAVQAAAADPSIKAFATISAADFGGRYLKSLGAQPHAAGTRSAIAKLGRSLAEEGMAPLSGCTPDGLAHDIASHATSWEFSGKVDALKTRTTLVVTSDDGLATENEALASALRSAGDLHVTEAHLPTDHAYSDRRKELSDAVLKWLATLPR